MNNPRLMSLAILATAIVIGGMVSAQANPDNAGNGGVAVVDLNQILNEADEREAIAAQMNELQADARTKLQEKQRELQRINDDLRVINPEDPEHEDLTNRRLRLQIELQHLQQFEERKLNAELLRQYERLYRRTTQVAGEIAQEQGYRIVLLKDAQQRLPHNIDRQQFFELLGRRKVLWSSGDIDLTAPVLQRLNQ